MKRKVIIEPDRDSLRDYFAAHAPPVPDWFASAHDCEMDALIAWRWYYADAMMVARNDVLLKGASYE